MELLGQFRGSEGNFGPLGPIQWSLRPLAAHFWPIHWGLRAILGMFGQSREPEAISVSIVPFKEVSKLISGHLGLYSGSVAHCWASWQSEVHLWAFQGHGSLVQGSMAHLWASRGPSIDYVMLKGE